MTKKRKHGGGRKPSKPDYNPSAILQNQMDAAVALYSAVDHPSLQAIANELDLNPSTIIYLIHMYVWTIYYVFAYDGKTFGIDSFIYTSIVSLIISIIYIFAKEHLIYRIQKEN